MRKLPRKELQLRIGTAVLGVGAILGLILYGGRIGMGLIVAVLTIVMIFELGTMVFQLKDAREKTGLLVGVGAINLLATLFMTSYGEFGALILSFLILGIYFLFTSARFSEGAELSVHFSELCASIFGLVYIVGFMGYLGKLHELPQGPQWTLLFLVIVWSADTGAYFAGLKLGKHKLFPKVSPKKTIEGAIGGLVTALCAAFAFCALFFHGPTTLGICILAVVVTSASIIGDLLESLLKRAFEKKDSGSILPGHGGVLDRFDAVVFSVPIMYACVRILA